MNKELQTRALRGDKEAMLELQKEIAGTGKEIIVMQRCLQSHFRSSDGKSWFLSTVLWTPWHREERDDPGFMVDEEGGVAFRNIKIEKQLITVDSNLLDPEEIPKLLERCRVQRESLQNLHTQLEEAVNSENYEKAAELRDEIKARLESQVQT